MIKDNLVCEMWYFKFPDDKPEDVAMFQEFLRKHVKPNNMDSKT